VCRIFLYVQASTSVCVNLVNLGSLLASVELAEQQVIERHDGGGSVGGESVYYFREGVA